jgi:hypothetical protein
MRSAGNFHPEWGYLAPAPSFMRTARVALVATAIGGTAGAVVVVSLVAHPGADADNTSIAAHALVTSPPVVVTSPVTAAPSGAKAAATAAPAPVAARTQPAVQLSAQAPAKDASASKLNAAAPPSPTVPAVASVSIATVTQTPPTTPEAQPATDQPDAAAPEEASDKKAAAKKHRIANNETVRRWETGNEARKKWRDNRGFGPLLRRLFSFRTGSSDYSN